MSCFLMAFTSENERAIVVAVETALDRARLSHKQAAGAMGLDLSLWTRQRHGDGHISLRRLSNLPPSFWREFVALQAQQLGLTVLSEGALTDALLTVVRLAQKTMLRMDLRKAKEQRRGYLKGQRGV